LLSSVHSGAAGITSVALAAMARPAFAPLCVAAALLAAAPLATRAMVYKGSVNGAINPFIGKFAFGVDSSGSPVGSVSLAWSTSTVRRPVLRMWPADGRPSGY
jgi:hypothetical protein